MANDTVQKYFDSLIETYDILVDAVGKANERGMKVSAKLAEDVVKGQREALTLGKKLAAENVIVWSGDGRVRAAVHLYNDAADIERFLETLGRVLP